MIKPAFGEEDGREVTAYVITASGKKALESGLKDLGGKVPAVQARDHKPYKNSKASTNGKAPKTKSPKAKTKVATPKKVATPPEFAIEAEEAS